VSDSNNNNLNPALDSSTDNSVNTDVHRRYMARALELAARGLNTASPNPRVGCLLVKDDEIIGEGWHQRTGQPHAEIEALASCSEANRARIKGATAYVTLEPCAHYGRTPPCCDRLIDVGVSRVVIGAIDPNPLVAGNGIKRMQAAGIDVISGVMADESQQLNCGFFSRMQRRRPWVRLKLAASLDGRTALASGESKWITSTEARYDVQRLRARADCILTGVGTVLADDPAMTVRAEGNPHLAEHRQPTLAIVDSKGRTPVGAKFFNAERDVLIFSNVDHLAATAGTVIHSHNPSVDGRICLSGVMRELAARDVNEVHVEGGAELAASLLAEQLVDELVVYQAPLLLGADAKSLVAMSGLTSMKQRLEFQFTDILQVGRDVRLTLTPLYRQIS
jgi:diaminohydroxyphosphoribosylaminopyrimidine deaminase/5-amino-6-(5-phosphoribosylamino)uracil reductase